MATTTDLQRLIVSMEARYTSLERQLARASGVANKRAREIETRFQRMNTSLAGSFGRLGGLLAGAVSIRAAQQLIDASTRIRNSLKVAGLEGEQLTRVYDALFASAQRNAAPIEALAELYGRAALVQKELGISTEELLRFTDKVAVALRVSGKSAQESSGALLQLSQALGSGIVRAEEFNSILEGALPIAQAAAAGLVEAGGSVAKLRTLVVDGKVSSEAFFRAFEAGASILDDKVAGAELTVSQGFVRLQNVMIDAAGRLNEVSGASKGAAAALELLADIIQAITDKSSLFMQALGNYATSMNNLGDSFQRLVNDPSFDNLADFLFVGSPNTPAQNRIIKVAEATEFLRQRLAALNQEAAAAAGGNLIPKTPGLADRFDDAFSAAKPVSLADYAAPDTKGAKTAADKAADAIRKVEESLRFQQEQLGRTAREQAVYNALNSAGVDINTAAGQRIAYAAGRLYDQEQAMDAAKEAAERFNDAVESLGGEVFDAFGQFVEGAKSAEDAIKDLIRQLLIAEARALFLRAISPTAAAGPIATALGGLFGGGRATGGPVSPGKIYKVHKDELIVPRVPGTVIPAAKANGGGGGAMTISVDVTGARGNAEIMEMVRAGVSHGLAQYDRTLPGKVAQVRSAPRRR